MLLFRFLPLIRVLGVEPLLHIAEGLARAVLVVAAAIRAEPLEHLHAQLVGRLLRSLRSDLRARLQLGLGGGGLRKDRARAREKAGDEVQLHDSYDVRTSDCRTCCTY